MPEITPRKLRVVADERAWANVRTQKMGWLRPTDVIEIFELYQGWTQFRPIEGGGDLIPLNDDYNQYWIDPNSEASFVDHDETPDPGPDPDPTPDPVPGDAITDEEAGSAMRTLVRFLYQVWNG